MDIKFQFEKLDKNKNIVSVSPKYQSKSFVENFLKLLFMDMIVGGLNIYGIDGVYRGMGASLRCVVNMGGEDFHRVSALADDWNRLAVSDVGIIIGSGTEPILITDYQLQTKIHNGNEAGELEYLPCSGTNFTVNTGTDVASFEIIRIFRNNTGDPITINEMGISQIGSYSGYSYYTPALIIRDLVDPGQTVDDGEYLKAKYTIQIAA